MSAKNLNRPSQRKSLFKIAHSLIEQTGVITDWSFVGGTAMMLQLDHRESHDVDIFLPDTQLLAFMKPERHDFTFEIMPSAYDGDGSRFLKISFGGIGEIDFIAAPTLTDTPTKTHNIEGVDTLLETIPEIITKKIYFRGASISARDIFDIAAASQSHMDELRTCLADYPDQVAATLQRLEHHRGIPAFIPSQGSAKK